MNENTLILTKTTCQPNTSGNWQNQKQDILVSHHITSHGTADMGQQTWDSKHGTANMGQQTWDSKHGTANMGQQTWDSKHGTANMGQPTWDSKHGTANMGQQTWDNKHGTADKGQQTLDSKHGTANMGQQTWDTRHRTPDMEHQTDHQTWITRQTYAYRERDTIRKSREESIGFNIQEQSIGLFVKFCPRLFVQTVEHNISYIITFSFDIWHLAFGIGILDLSCQLGE